MSELEKLGAWPQSIPIIQPTLPDINSYIESIHEIFSSKWLTNNGKFHRLLEERLGVYSGNANLSLVNNGTMALLVALRALDMNPSGEIITTPFTFAATTHSIDWLGYTPVFADIDPDTGNICPNSVRNNINDNTAAIMAVHVFGTPCDLHSLEDISDSHGIPIVYDAAHAFGVEVNGKSIFTYGDASATSFHATKLFSSVEGGAVYFSNKDLKQKADKIKNFGILNENVIQSSGLNMKMSELHAAFGLLVIEQVEEEIIKRQKIADIYHHGLSGIRGIKIITNGKGFKPNWAYYAILVDNSVTGISRNELYDELKNLNIFCRKYFYPLTSTVPKYNKLPSSSRIPVAKKWEENVLCIPIYGTLELSAAKFIVESISKIVEISANNSAS